MTDQKVHVYTATREERLLQLVFFLWAQLPPQAQDELREDIEAEHMGWAIPSWERRHPDDWLTLTELTAELGMTLSGIRNWQSRYGLTPVKGRYRWGDVEDTRRQRIFRRRKTPDAS